MDLHVHADDLGASPGVNRSILRCHDEGHLTGVSVLATGPAFEEAIAELHRRPRLRSALHLDLAEGRPVAPARDVPLLVGPDGRFSHSFLSLWRAGAAAGTKDALASQLRIEIGAQLGRWRAATGEHRPVAVDGHRHYHLLPCVMEALLSLADEHRVERIRLVREPLSVAVSAVPAPAGLAKRALLNALSRRHAGALRRRGIGSSEHFVGALHSGRMSAAVVAVALRILSRRHGDGASVELLFHPGRARREEAALWTGVPAFAAFYLSPARDREAECLRSAELAACLRRHRAAAGAVAEAP